VHIKNFSWQQVLDHCDKYKYKSPAVAFVVEGSRHKTKMQTAK